MTTFQVILIILITILFLIISRSKLLILERLFSLAIVLGGFVFVIFPDLTTRIANFVGIGRGTDLILYLFIIYAIFRFSITSTRFKVTDQKLTRIVRHIALSNPLYGGNADASSGINQVPDEMDSLV